MPKPDSHTKPLDQTVPPPVSIPGILVRLGPGLIVAGSIVGSGELIATTATGAQAGFILLWLIVIGCVIKVFVQVELGRYTITSGKTTMESFAEVPGPGIRGRGNWLVWYWFIMFLASIAQLGGIVGGVGQALSISAPLTKDGVAWNEYARVETQLKVTLGELDLYSDLEAAGDASASERAAELQKQIAQLELESFTALSDRLSAQRPQQADFADKSEYEAAVAKHEQIKLAYASAAEKLTNLNSELADGKLSPDEERARLANLAELSRIGQLQRKINKQQAAVDAAATVPQQEAAQDKLKSLRSVQAEQLEQLHQSENGLSDITLGRELIQARSVEALTDPWDDEIWAAIITALTAIILIFGRYGLIQSFSTAMVAMFTLITIVNLAMLQSSPTWGVSLDDIWLGMQFRLGGSNALTTALATFGIIGVGASELVTYPYWCLEKGYARFTGDRNNTNEWADRARGWLRVMRWDAWCSMVVYTFATIAFYLLGASVLHPTGLDPKGPEMIRTLAVMYEPAFGVIAQGVFLFGAFAVLYSTFFVANASHARVFSDAIKVMGLAQSGDKAHRWRVRFLSGLFPFLCFAFYVWLPEPQTLVLISGIMQAIMLPMLAAAALFFRYYRSDERTRPNMLWDIFLWISAAGMFVAGVWAGWSKIEPWFAGWF